MVTQRIRKNSDEVTTLLERDDLLWNKHGMGGIRPADADEVRNVVKSGSTEVEIHVDRKVSGEFLGIIVKIGGGRWYAGRVLSGQLKT